MIPLYQRLLPAFQDHSAAFERFVELVRLTDKKSQRGWNDGQCALYLLPLRLHEEFYQDPQYVFGSFEIVPQID
jgi:hypothetical protein